MKKLFLVSLVFVIGLFLIGCAQEPENTIDVSIGEEVVVTEDDTVKDNVEVIKKTTSSSAGEVKEFTMIAKQWEFVPNRITVNKGDTLKITIKSTDVPHGFKIKEYGIDQYLPVNEQHTIEFVADKEGVFDFFCNVYCGSGHGGMRGKLVVE